MAGVLGLAVLLPASSASATPQAGFTPPATPTEAVPFLSLPDCVTDHLRGATDGAGLPEGAQLGWKDHPRMAATWGNYVNEWVPVIPCTNKTAANSGPGTFLSVGVSANAVAGQNGLLAWASAAGNMKLVVKCYVNGAVVTIPTAPDQSTGLIAVVPGPPGSPLAMSGIDSMDTSVTLTTCPAIVSVTLFVGLSNPNDHTAYVPQVTWTWQALLWTTASGGYVRATTPNGILPPGVELPIVCLIDNSGTDIVTVTQNVWVSMGRLPACLLIPVGWDRAQRIAAVWNSGGAGQLSAAFHAAVPSGLSCGSVAAIPKARGSGTYDLNTCNVDIAPGWVKTGVSWVIVLGIGALIVRRIFWVVGSKS